MSLCFCLTPTKIYQRAKKKNTQSIIIYKANILAECIQCIKQYAGKSNQISMKKGCNEKRSAVRSAVCAASHGFHLHHSDLNSLCAKHEQCPRVQQ